MRFSLVLRLKRKHGRFLIEKPPMHGSKRREFVYTMAYSNISSTVSILIYIVFDNLCRKKYLKYYKNLKQPKLTG